MHLLISCSLSEPSAEHGGPVWGHTRHPGRHDASHPLREGGPRVSAGHRLLGRPGVLQLRLWPRDHRVHRDEQDQGHRHQRSHLHGETVILL